MSFETTANCERSEAISARNKFKKLLRIMRLTAFLILVAALHVGARGLTQTVTLSVKNAPLDKVFEQVKKQTGYSFMWDENTLSGTRPVSLEMKNATIQQVMDACVKDQPITYTVIDNLVLIKPKTKSPNDNSAVILSGVETRPPVDIIGRVTDKDGNPLVGASVKVKGSSNGTTTNENGEYTLHNVGENATLEITYIGYEPITIALKGRNNISSSLEVKPQSLDQVQIIGYGQTTRRFNTGSQSTVRAEEIQKQPVSDPLMALEGRVAGVYINQASGIPGSNFNLQLRGQNSIANGNNPLYIVDGVPFNSTTLTSKSIGGGPLGVTTSRNFGLSPFNTLNPLDIESIEVLKDADATAIYGSQGANGVILITTKKGKPGKTNFDLNMYTGFGKVERTIKMLNTKQYLKVRHDALSSDGISTIPTNAYDLNGTWDSTRYTDWEKVFIGGANKFSNVQATFSGGNSNTQFLMSGNYSRQTTVYPGDFNDKRGSVDLSLNHTSSNQRLHVQLSTSYGSDNSKLPAVDFTTFINTYAPDAPALFNSDGSLNWQNNTWSNPFAILNRKANAVTDNLVSNLVSSYEVLSGLLIKASVGYNHAQMNQSIQFPTSSFSPSLSNIPAVRSNSMAINDYKLWIAEPQLIFKKRINNGNFEALIGTSLQKNQQNLLALRSSGFANDILISNISFATNNTVLNNSQISYRYNALFGRLKYNWKEKYLINITARRDGSSRFGPGRQFGNFGAVGAGWIFSEENFLKRNLKFLSYGKLRVSYGTTGNDQITDYQYLSTYTSFSYPYQGIIGLQPTRLANPEFGWELVKKVEAGLDLGLLKDRVLFGIDFYRNQTNNQLVGYPLASTAGFTTIQENLPAVVQNIGVELETNATLVKSKGFSWQVNANVTIPKNKLISYPNLESSAYANAYVVGQSLFITKRFKYTGVNAQTGLYTFSTKNSNGIPNYGTEFISTRPLTQLLYGGLGSNLSYKNFTISFLFQFVKQYADNYSAQFRTAGPLGAPNVNYPALVINSYWTTPGDQKNIQRLTQTGGGTIGDSWNNAVRYSDYTVENASFVRLKNVYIGYDMPSKWMEKIRFKSSRIYLQGQNLFTITKYTGLDPETLSLSLPPLRMITGGVQLSF